MLGLFPESRICGLWFRMVPEAHSAPQTVGYLGLGYNLG